MASKSPALEGYETFIAEVRNNLAAMNLAEAIRLAIKACINKNFLVSFLREHGSEVENMLCTEWNWADALAVRYDEGFATGQENKEKEKEEAVKEFKNKVFDLWRRGYSLDEAERMLSK